MDQNPLDLINHDPDVWSAYSRKWGLVTHMLTGTFPQGADFSSAILTGAILDETLLAAQRLFFSL